MEREPAAVLEGNCRYRVDRQLTRQEYSWAWTAPATWEAVTLTGSFWSLILEENDRGLCCAGGSEDRGVECGTERDAGRVVVGALYMRRVDMVIHFDSARFISGANNACQIALHMNKASCVNNPGDVRPLAKGNNCREQGDREATAVSRPDV